MDKYRRQSVCVNLGHVNLLLPTILGFKLVREPHTPRTECIMGYNIICVQGS